MLKGKSIFDCKRKKHQSDKIDAFSVARRGIEPLFQE